MKAIQSFWSKPFLDDENDRLFHSNFGGFISPKALFQSWTLSVLKLRANFADVVLVTDKAGKRILIDELKLPYTQYVVALDDINNYDKRLWALGKIYTYHLQKEPFFHLDGDAFIWSPLRKALQDAALICQHLEPLNEITRPAFAEIIEHLDHVPEEIEPYRQASDPGLRMINAGIIGGNDIDFFQRYTRKAFQFVDRNLGALDQINTHLMNCVFEQCLFTSLARMEQKEITQMITSPVSKNFKELLSFNLLPKRTGYIHLVGSHKRNPVLKEQIMLHLKYKYPEYFDRIEYISNRIS